MSGPVCAITGANGFLGRTLVRHVQALGWRAIALQRNPMRAPANLEAREFILGERTASSTLKGVDFLVHSAYDFSLCGWADICRVNVVGSEYLFDAATRAGVRRPIFISSMAAFEGCRSQYGRGKLAAEDSARIRGGLSIRPGVIYSEENASIAGKIEAMARKAPIIPMIGDGRYPLYTCHVDDLCALILRLAEAPTLESAIVTAANPTPITLLDIALAASGGKKRWIAPVPWQLVRAGLVTLEAIGLRPGFRSDSVVSLVHSDPDVDVESLRTLPTPFRPFRPTLPLKSPVLS
jgi:nucleoside-diphosphate-sugar epimerase